MGTAAINTAAHAKRLDRADPLRRYRRRFNLPKGPDGKPGIYFLGHSLGAQPRATPGRVSGEMDRWADEGLESFFTPGSKGQPSWLEYYQRATRLMAPIVGAKTSEVGLMAGLTINLHFMLTPFYTPTPSRYKILMSELAFPSDRYGVESHVKTRARQLRAYMGRTALNAKDAIVWLKPRPGSMLLEPDDILDAIEEHGRSLSMVFLENPSYLTGQVLDMRPIVQAAHAKGAYVGLDLAHGAGNIEPHLHRLGIDFAVWCTYKYLNSGPGGIAGFYIHERHHRRRELAHLIGWFANRLETRFEMRRRIDRAPGAEGFLAGTPSIVLLATLLSSLEIFEEAGMPAISAKRNALTGYLLDLLSDLEPQHLEIITPKDPRFRGAAVCLRIPKKGKAIVSALRDEGIFTDFRYPNIVRLAAAPLNNNFFEARAASNRVHEQLLSAPWPICSSLNRDAWEVFSQPQQVCIKGLPTRELNT